MVAVRAYPIVGAASGNPHTSGRTVYPRLRVSGMTTSSALQIVGVSNATSAASSCSDGKFIDSLSVEWVLAFVAHGTSRSSIRQSRRWIGLHHFREDGLASARQDRRVRAYRDERHTGPEQCA